MTSTAALSAALVGPIIALSIELSQLSVMRRLTSDAEKEFADALPSVKNFGVRLRFFFEGTQFLRTLPAVVIAPAISIVSVTIENWNPIYWIPLTIYFGSAVILLTYLYNQNPMQLPSKSVSKGIKWTWVELISKISILLNSAAVVFIVGSLLFR